MIVASLCGCASTTNAVIESLQFAIGKDAPASSTALNPAFRYLRATINGREVLLVLGYVEGGPHQPVEVWYSAEREVLRLRNGRVVGLVGTTAEWRQVVLPELPSWSALARTESESRWVRVRDAMPGYRIGVRDELAVRVVPPPARSDLRNLDPGSLTWFEERIENPDRWWEGGDALRTARYALSLRDGVETVVYGEQCIARNLCFSWQRWPAPIESARQTH